MSQNSQDSPPGLIEHQGHPWGGKFDDWQETTYSSEEGVTAIRSCLDDVFDEKGTRAGVADDVAGPYRLSRRYAGF